MWWSRSSTARKPPKDILEKFLPWEMEILAVLNHGSIPKTCKVSETSYGKVYIVMELAVQGNLLEFIECQGALPEDVACKMLQQLSSAIKYCHKLDIVHQNLKCENLFLDKDLNIKLSNFRFSMRCLWDDNMKQDLLRVGGDVTPKVLQGIRYQPKVYNIWILGVILYIMVCGATPYDNFDIRNMPRIQKEHRVDFPHSKNLTCEYKDLIYRMLQPNVSQRLHIHDILSQCWEQPNAQGLPSVAINKDGESSWGTEPSGCLNLALRRAGAWGRGTAKGQPKTKPEGLAMQMPRQSDTLGFPSKPSNGERGRALPTWLPPEMRT
ncbi:Testis-specific serine/threonine-protein kinase 1 [Plecturocebus cupreus]